MIKLYNLPRSGNCYKIRLLLALLDLEHEIIDIDAKAGENTTAEFLRLNPRGQLPVLDDDGEVLWDSTAILVYLADRYGGDDWLPRDSLGLARVMQWLALEQNEGRYGLARARAHALGNPNAFARDANPEECRALAMTALQVLEERLAANDWLAADQVTIADIACYPYVAMAGEGNIDIAPFAAVQTWTRRIAKLPRYLPLP